MAFTLQKRFRSTFVVCKAETLKSLGADHVISSKTDPNWGATAKRLTSRKGVDNVIEVGGLNTLTQSLKAVKLRG